MALFPFDFSPFKLPENSGFGLENLPLCVFSERNKQSQVGYVYGDYVISFNRLRLKFMHPAFYLSYRKKTADTLLGNEFFNATIKKLIADIYNSNNPEFLESFSRCLVLRSKVKFHIPFTIRNYTDFYASEAHATRVGSTMRSPENALPEQWKHLPIAYHGRASSIILSGVDIKRPKGQIRISGGGTSYEFTRALDYEIEIGIVIKKDSVLGEPIPMEEAEDYIAGFVILNDWSARDIQRWEYQPLGPFLGKSFATSISPFVIPLEALEKFRTTGVEQIPEPLPYLKNPSNNNYFDITLTATLQTKKHPDFKTEICRTNLKNTYWSAAQMIAHHTSNGCNLQAGDILGTGTISGWEHNAKGCLLELTEGGKTPFTLDSGETRIFLENGDTITLHAFAEREGVRIDFGELRNTIV